MFHFFLDFDSMELDLKSIYLYQIMKKCSLLCVYGVTLIKKCNFFWDVLADQRSEHHRNEYLMKFPVD